MQTQPDPSDSHMQALAKKNAAWIISNRWRVMGKAVGVVTQGGNVMVTRADDELVGVDVLFRAPLTIETKTEAGLIKALLDSALHPTLSTV